MSDNYYDNETTKDNALRTICHLCEENSKLHHALEGMKRVNDNAMQIIGTRNEEIAELKKRIEDLEYEIELLSQDHEGYDLEDEEDECPSVSACSVMIDPPSGWKYGFPKVMSNAAEMKTDRDVNTWLFDNGYPFEEIAVWVPKNKQKHNMSLDYVLEHANVAVRAWPTWPASEDQS